MSDSAIVAALDVGDDEGLAEGRGPLPGYFGSKGAAGVAEQIISRMPPHSVYVESFLGGGAVLRRKPPALSSIAIDADARVIDRWRLLGLPGLELICGDAIAWIEGPGRDLPADALVYADPPYPHSCRQSRRRYRCELTESDHWRLLTALVDLPCSVMISSYANPLYASLLRGWDHATFPGMTRGGVRAEHLWSRSTIAAGGVGICHAGKNFRERERIKRKAQRWASMWAAMPPSERDAVLGAVLRARGSIEIPHRR